jgi:hypothetical protein
LWLGRTTAWRLDFTHPHLNNPWPHFKSFG